MADEIIKVQIIGHVDTSIPGPWQTLGDYQQDRKRQAILFWIQIIVGLLTAASLMLGLYLQGPSMFRTGTEYKQETKGESGSPLEQQRQDTQKQKELPRREQQKQIPK